MVISFLSPKPKVCLSFPFTTEAKDFNNTEEAAQQTQAWECENHISKAKNAWLALISSLNAA